MFMEAIGIVDVFAGPGGLGEGFCPVSAGRSWPFEMAASVEKCPSAHQTLLLRAFLRKFRGELPQKYYDFLNGSVAEPNWKADYAPEWNEAEEEAKCLTLGDANTHEFLKERTREIRQQYGNRTVLLGGGGPPCQAHSLAGRVRNASISGYLVHKDERTRLYKEYIKALKLLERLPGWRFRGEVHFNPTFLHFKTLKQGVQCLSPCKNLEYVRMDVMDTIAEQIESNPIILYMKGTPQQPMCGFSARTVQCLMACGKPFAYVDVLSHPEIRASLPDYADWPTFPQLFVEGELMGGCDIVTELYESGELQPMIEAVGAETD